MTDERENPDPDLEQALADYLAAQRMTRRQLLERIAAVGAAAALAPVIAACSAGPASQAADQAPAGTPAKPAAPAVAGPAVAGPAVAAPRRGCRSGPGCRGQLARHRPDHRQDRFPGLGIGPAPSRLPAVVAGSRPYLAPARALSRASVLAAQAMPPVSSVFGGGVS